MSFFKKVFGGVSKLFSPIAKIADPFTGGLASKALTFFGGKSEGSFAKIATALTTTAAAAQETPAETTKPASTPTDEAETATREKASLRKNKRRSRSFSDLRIDLAQSTNAGGPPTLGL